MVSSSYQFKIYPLLTISVLFAVVVMFLLGGWQLNRADEKRQLLEQREIAGTLAPIEIEYIDDVEHALYRDVKLVGRFEEKYFLVDNQLRNGKVGFEVIQLFALDVGKQILVNRGWIPANQNITDLPNVETPGAQIEVIGRLTNLPQVGYKLDFLDSGQWPKVVQYLDKELLSSWFDEHLYPYVIQLSPEQEFGFERTWPGIPTYPEKHTAYAFQWFGMAVALIVVFLFFSFKKVVGE